MVLSIIVPCYNSKNYLNRCLDSLKKIESNQIEFLIVNDGSTDSTMDIANTFVDSDKRFRIISKENGGYSSAINFGIDNAFGEYLMFLGSDDEVFPKNIDILLTKINDKPDIVFFTTLKQFEDGTSTLDEMTNYKNEYCYNLDLFSLCQRIDNDSRIVFTRDTSRLFKKSIVGDQRYFGKVGVSADGCFSTIIASKSISFLFCNIVCYKWYLRNDSVSGKEKNINSLLDEMHVWKSFFSQIKIIYNEKPIPRIIINYIWSYFGVCKRLKKFKQIENRDGFSDIKDIISWFLKRKDLPIKDKVKFFFPNLYYVYFKKHYG